MRATKGTRRERTNQSRRAWTILILVASLAALECAGAAGAFPAAPAEEPELPAETPDEFFAAAYRRHMAGELNEAIALYRKSIAHRPTAPGHTFLGWAYAHQGRVDEAIAECERAIAIDPDYGNPWNDIGSYLISKGELDRAIPFLQRATKAERYCCPHFPHLNLGRVYLLQRRFRDARREFERVLELVPGYPPAIIWLKILEALMAQEPEETI
jgi:tetratricopeptide (TPR) repeat protein